MDSSRASEDNTPATEQGNSAAYQVRRLRRLAEQQREEAGPDAPQTPAELTELEKAMHLAERKTAWEALHPEARQGGAPGNKGQGRGKAPAIKEINMTSLIEEDQPEPVQSFVESTAEKTGMSASTIQRLTRIDKKLAPEVKEMLARTNNPDHPTGVSCSLFALWGVLAIGRGPEACFLEMSFQGQFYLGGGRFPVTEGRLYPYRFSTE